MTFFFLKLFTLFKFGFKQVFKSFEFLHELINKMEVHRNNIKCKNNASATSKKNGAISSGLAWKSIQQSPVEEDNEEQTQFPSLSDLMKQNGVIDDILFLPRNLAKQNLF